MVTFDTSALLALIESRQLHHHEVLEIAEANPGTLVVPMGIMSGLPYFVESGLGHRVLSAFLHDLRDDTNVTHSGDSAFERIAGLIERCKDLPLGYADAAFNACAERHGGQVAAPDRRHFGVIAPEGTIQVVP